MASGIKKKFGYSELSKGKHFFDKIIQLSFKLPVNQYDEKKYIENLLIKSDFSFDKEDLTSYVDLTKHSIGFNPRNIKRLFNSLLLTHKVFLLKQTDSKIEEKMLYAALCFQSAFELAYNLLLKTSNADTTNDLQKTLQELKDLKQTETTSPEKSLAERLFNKKFEELEHFADFYKDFFKLLQEAEDNDDDDDKDESEDNFSEEKLQQFKTILALTAINSSNTVDTTATENTEDAGCRYTNRQTIKQINALLNNGNFLEDEKRKAFESHADKKDIFYIYQGNKDATAYSYATIKEAVLDDPKEIFHVNPGLVLENQKFTFYFSVSSPKLRRRKSMHEAFKKIIQTPINEQKFLQLMENFKQSEHSRHFNVTLKNPLDISTRYHAKIGLLALKNDANKEDALKAIAELYADMSRICCEIFLKNS